MRPPRSPNDPLSVARDDQVAAVSQHRTEQTTGRRRGHRTRVRLRELKRPELLADPNLAVQRPRPDLGHDLLYKRRELCGHGYVNRPLEGPDCPRKRRCDATPLSKRFEWEAWSDPIQHLPNDDLDAWAEKRITPQQFGAHLARTGPRIRRSGEGAVDHDRLDTLGELAGDFVESAVGGDPHSIDIGDAIDGQVQGRVQDGRKRHE